MKNVILKDKNKVFIINVEKIEKIYIYRNKNEKILAIVTNRGLHELCIDVHDTLKCEQAYLENLMYAIENSKVIDVTKISDWPTISVDK